MGNNLFEKAETKRLSLADHVLTKVTIPVDVIDECVNIFFREIISSLAEGKDAKIAGFGTFSVREKKARVGRNPATKQEFNIAARKSVSFKTSNLLKKKLNNEE